jgi:hypothetical protein
VAATSAIVDGKVFAARRTLLLRSGPLVEYGIDADAEPPAVVSTVRVAVPAVGPAKLTVAIGEEGPHSTSPLVLLSLSR